VSDSTAFEAPAGIISFLGKIFEIRRGLVRDTQTGAIGGSASSLWLCLCNLEDWSGMQLCELAATESLNPARVLGLDAELGSIEPGKKADFFLSGPDRRIKAVYRNGMPIWQA
jgi:N-acetylgalactosamine-6-phosphate deacetylase